LGSWSNEPNVHLQHYEKAAGFVPKLTTKVVSYLNPQPGEKILDIGCGDGILTVEIAKATNDSLVVGLDASASMIQTANELAKSSKLQNCSFAVEDCATFASPDASKILNGSWDKVFSNAAYHWILRRPESRVEALRAAYRALKPGGTFVFECGGYGNVAEMQTAIIAAMVANGVPLIQARERLPWFFASEDWMRQTLEGLGFCVEKLELEYRPTKLTETVGTGQGGLEGWVRLFGASILDGLEKSEEIVRHICDYVDTAITREDGTQWIGYVRLRGVAAKPDH
jgi:SAM-dependent methyltransferase